MRETIFSNCKKYRYTLWREWTTLIEDCRYAHSYVNFICLNPSTATAIEDDPTIRRCVGFAKRWGYGAMCMTNLFAYRSTNPIELTKINDPIGNENNEYLKRIADHALLIIIGWGNHGDLLNRDKEILSFLKNPMCLGITKNNQPRHPLYVSYCNEPILFDTQDQ